MQGRHARQAPNTYTDLTINNVIQGMKRVARYTKNFSTDVENLELIVIEGLPSSSTGVAPEITTGDIFEGCTLHEMPLCRVKMDGLEISSISEMFTTLTDLENHSLSKLYRATIRSNWSGSRVPYTQNVTVAGILSDDSPISFRYRLRNGFKSARSLEMRF